MISVIIPTMGTRKTELTRLLQSLDKQTMKDFEVIIVSQKNYEIVDEIIQPYSYKINHIKIQKTGLSHARNVGIAHVKGSIVTFSDDDCWYKEDCFENVKQYFATHNVDIACFQIYDPIRNEYYKNYPTEANAKLNEREIFKKSSIEIFVNLESINRDLVRFDEQFGLGGIYPSGEENIFLHTLVKAGYTISYEPKIVVYHEKPEIETRLNLQAFKSKGPLFKRLYNTPVGLVLLTLLFLKKFKHLEQPFKYYMSAVKELFKYKKPSI